jgi:hypothetical protein
MRGDPIVAATCVMEQICTVGMPARSLSFAIAAPQRVLRHVNKGAQTKLLLDKSTVDAF